MSIRDNSPEGQRNRQKLVDEALDNWKTTHPANNKQNNIKTDNELIAEFMDWEHCSSELCLKNNNLCWTNPSDCTRGYMPKQDLKFHISWDWLMPVANKIQKLYTSNFGVIQKELRDDRSFIARMAVKQMFGFSEVTGQLEINSVYLKCLDFIKWYNTVTKQALQKP